MQDPNPLVGGGGLATLRAAGVEVALMDGPEAEGCLEINAEFMERMRGTAAKAAAEQAAAAAEQAAAAAA